MGPKLSPENLPLIARGGQADIYDCGDGRILRVPRLSRDFDRIRYEYQVYSLLNGSGISAPRVFDLVDVNGAPSIVMERALGRPMIADIAARPLRIRKLSRELAELHVKLLGMQATEPLVKDKAKARHCILSSPRLSEDAKKTLVGLLEGLPEGNSLCHGDFHPGNIIRDGERDWIIDWSGASRGDPHADVAHSYLLLRVVPRVGGISRLQHAIQRQFARRISVFYLARMKKESWFNLATFSHWVLIKAAERSFYGQPGEQEKLASFIGTCLRVMPAAAQGTPRFFELL